MLIRDFLSRIGSGYLSAKNQRFAQHPLANFIRNKADDVFSEFISDNIILKSSPGQGNWANIPNICFLNKEETNSPQRGIYVVYLFSEDMKRVFLTLAQGTTCIKDSLGKIKGFKKLRENASKIYDNFDLSSLSDFDKGPDLDIGDSIRAEWYEQSVILFKKYDLNNLPEEEVLRSDLKKLLKFYNKWVKEKVGFEEKDSVNDLIINIKNSEKEITKQSNDSKIKDIEFKNINLSVDDFNSIKNKLIFDNFDSLINQIVAGINLGKNIMFVGPPGTGKTELARQVCLIIKNEKNKSLVEGFNGFEITTATSDWTTFDLIGGYVPSEEKNSLVFQEGQLLNCLPNDNDPSRNKWLIIDEINRSDIDKAFGPVFTVLSGQPVELTFKRDKKLIKVHKPIDESNYKFDNDHFNYWIPKNWRLFATLNTYDKSSLYEMSYAFMRRFMFVYVNVPSKEFIQERFNDYLNSWGLNSSEAIKIKQLWIDLLAYRKIGPALIRDLIKLTNEGVSLTDAIISTLLPQFEGLRENKLVAIAKIIWDLIGDKDKIKNIFEEFFELSEDDWKKLEQKK